MSRCQLLPFYLFGIITALQIPFLSLRPAISDTLSTYNLLRASSYIFADLAFGNQNFKFLVDTGSSDTWVVLSDFECKINGAYHPQQDCKLGPLYNLEDGFTEIRDQALRAIYSSMAASGYPGTTSITLGGLTAVAEVGVVDHLYNPGSSMAHLGSGLLGLAFSPITSNYPDNVPWSKNLTNIPSKSVMTTIFEQNQIPHKFALAVSRGEKNSSDGGTFSIGGLPNLLEPRVNATNDFASTALVATTDFLTTQIAWYAITVESLYYGTFGNMSINSTAGNYIVDTGSPAIVLPANDTEHWLSMFDPPMPFNNETFEVNCNATIPLLQFRIGGMIFPMNPVDLVIHNSDGKCFSTVQPSSSPPYILGDRFHRNVLAVYDWENEQMHFAPRPYYES